MQRDCDRSITMKRFLPTVVMLTALAGFAHAQNPGSQGPILYSRDCAHSPQFGKAVVCYDTVLKNFYSWNATATPPAFELTNSGSGNATTINGAALPASATVVGTNSSKQIIAPTVQGNGAKVQLSTGSTTTNDCVKFDANGNTVDAWAGCVSDPT